MSLQRLVLSATAIALVPGSAWAQSTGQTGLAQSAPEQENSGLEEIIVDAQKREHKMQDVAVAVTAPSGDPLQGEGRIGWYRNPSCTSQDSLGIAYGYVEKHGANFGRIEAVAEVDGSVLALDLKAQAVRGMVRSVATS